MVESKHLNSILIILTDKKTTCCEVVVKIHKIYFNYWTYHLLL